MCTRSFGHHNHQNAAFHSLPSTTATLFLVLPVAAAALVLIASSNDLTKSSLSSLRIMSI